MTMNRTNGPHAPIPAPVATLGEEPGSLGAGNRTPQDVAALFEIAAGDKDAIQRLTGCVAQLTRAQAAKEALARLTPSEVRQGLEHRHPRCEHPQTGLPAELNPGDSR
jgi:hypothetical protein